MAVPDMRTADVAGESFARLPEISLDELAASASLLTRIDRKYLLQADVAADLVASLAASGARALTIDGQSAFGYLSDYDDTPDFSLSRGCHETPPAFQAPLPRLPRFGDALPRIEDSFGAGAQRQRQAPFGGRPGGRLRGYTPRAQRETPRSARSARSARMAGRTPGGQGDRRNPPRGAEGRGQPDPGGPIGLYAFDPLPARRLSADGRSRPRPLRALGRRPRRGSRRRRRNEVRRARLRRRQVALEQRTSPAEDLEVRARRRVDPSRIALQPLE